MPEAEARMWAASLPTSCTPTSDVTLLTPHRTKAQALLSVLLCSTELRLGAYGSTAEWASERELLTRGFIMVTITIFIAGTNSSSGVRSERNGYLAQRLGLGLHVFGWGACAHSVWHVGGHACLAIQQYTGGDDTVQPLQVRSVGWSLGLLLLLQVGLQACSCGPQRTGEWVGWQGCRSVGHSSFIIGGWGGVHGWGGGEGGSSDERWCHHHQCFSCSTQDGDHAQA